MRPLIAKSGIAKSGGAFVMAFAVCGCQPDALSLRDVASPQLGVVTISRAYDIPSGSCSQARPAVKRFIETTADGRPESLRVVIEAPRAACAGLVVSAVEDAGVPRSRVLLRTGQATKSAHEGAHLSVDRLVADGADCYVPRAPNYISPNDNGFDPAIGCSTLNNIGEMVADPEDLRVGRARVKAEGEPAASAVAAERQQRREVVLVPPPGPPQDRVRTTAAP